MDGAVSGRAVRAPGTPLVVQAGLTAVVIAVVLAAALLLHDRLVNSIDDLQTAVMAADARTDATATVLEALKDAETGQRGFLLTGRDSYLEPYRSCLARIPQALDRLDRMVAGSPALQDDAARLREAAAGKLAELQRTIEAAQTQGRDAAIAIVETDVGQKLMDSARASAAALTARTTAERDRAQREQRVRERESSVATVAAAAIGMALLGAAVLGLLAARRRLMGAQAVLRLRSDQLSGAVANLPDGVAVFDAEGRLTTWNDRFFPVSGVPRGRGFAEFEAAASDWPAEVLAGIPVSSTHREFPLGDRTLSVWRAPMPDGGQILTVADVTDRVRTESIARQAMKLDALGQLTGGVAHDFNNLLQILSANLELIATRLTDIWLLERLSAALSGVERAAQLTRHMLAFARRQPLAPRAFNVVPMLEGMSELLRRTLGSVVEIELAITGGLWPALADQNQLENAILNLAINARDAMPEGGHLTIEAANTSLDAAYAAANTEVRPGDYVMIALTDTGTGMTPEQLARAVEPFYTTKPEGRGTGLGLSMVYGFAKQSGGHFKLYSEAGHGTTARLYIPRSATEPPPAPRADEAPAPADGEMILVVEDEPTVRAAVGQTLRGMGYQTIEVATTAEALACLREGTQVDLLFTDVVMPGALSPREMAAQAAELLPGLPVIFTSGYTQNSIIHNGRLDPGVTLVSKPWRAAELARALRRALTEARGRRAEATGDVQPATRILLVEDEELIRFTTAEMLIELGFEVAEAARGAEALERLAAGGIDMLIVDFGLPDMDGREVIARALEKQPDLAVITASGQRPEAGPFVWLQKPYDGANLRDAVERAARPRPVAAG